MLLHDRSRPGHDSRIGLGAQTMHDEAYGAYTGEISAPMLRELGVQFVLLGHSERRAMAAESDAAIHRKVQTAIAHEMTPIVCVGETLDEHEAGQAIGRVRLQVQSAFADLAPDQVKHCVVAYEPIWAIGTGKSDDPKSADAVMGAIRAAVPGLEHAAIIYGGSVKPENIASFMEQPNINGALVGGASLEHHTFSEIVRLSSKAAHPNEPRALTARPRHSRRLGLHRCDPRQCHRRSAHAGLAEFFWGAIPGRRSPPAAKRSDLPAGIMGNSEVGHLNIGSGRIVPQGVSLINDAIADGSFATNAVLAECSAHVKARAGRLRFMGLLSDGCVHSSIAHLEALIDVAAATGTPFAIDIFPDGRDVPPQSALVFLERLERKLAEVKRPEAIATVIGRFYAMDRDKRWERIEPAYAALAEGRAPFSARTAREAIETAYARGETDEFIQPTVIGNARPINDGDAVIFFNFRPDRARQMTLAFSNPDFNHFSVKHYHELLFATMTRYDETFPNPVLFGPRPQFGTLGDTLSQAGLRQFRLAETEKYAHVTYFFNGGREDVLPGEDRMLIASDRSVETYDLAPQMRAPEITDAAIDDLRSGKHDVIILNYANADMLGHTGNFEATVVAVEVLDRELGRLSEAVLAAGGTWRSPPITGTPKRRSRPRASR